MELKTCSKCEEIKPLEEFNKHSDSRDGRAWACKVCQMAYRRAYYQENKESIAKKNKAYREENKEYYAKKNKAYREENKELLSEQIKRWYQQNREATLKQQEVYKRENKEAITKYKKAYRKENKEVIAKKMKAYREENKEAIAEYHKAYQQDNKEELAEYKKTYYEGNKEAILEQKKAYYQKNKESIAKYNKVYMRDLRRNDPTVRLLGNMRNGMYLCLKGKIKKSHTLDYVGKNSEELMAYLEVKFTKGMTRENYGEWHLDHIRPLSSFGFDEHEVGSQEFEKLLYKAWNFKNLQPLWAKDNLIKGNKYES